MGWLGLLLPGPFPCCFILSLLGYAMGKGITIQGHTYIEFLIPGLAAMVSMTQFLCHRQRDQYRTVLMARFRGVPGSAHQQRGFRLGRGAGRHDPRLPCGLCHPDVGSLLRRCSVVQYFLWSAFLLNSLIFSSLAVGLVMLIKSHADQAMLTSFVITPMAFLGGTFSHRTPSVLAQNILCWLPLTHAANAIRASSFN